MSYETLPAIFHSNGAALTVIDGVTFAAVLNVNQRGLDPQTYCAVLQAGSPSTTPDDDEDNPDPSETVFIRPDLADLFDCIIVTATNENYEHFRTTTTYIARRDHVQKTLTKHGIRPEIAAFLTDGNLGLSSATILRHLGEIDPNNPGLKQFRGYSRYFPNTFRPYAPQDEDDRKRCHKLLALFPNSTEIIIDLIDSYPDHADYWQRMLNDGDTQSHVTDAPGTI